MSEVVWVLDELYRANDGQEFLVEVRGVQSGHVWYGWLAFLALGDVPELETDRETTQPNRNALAYWAAGLEPVYLDGAFERASRLQARLHAQRLRERIFSQVAEIVDHRWSVD
jgi:hypothetical protein